MPILISYITLTYNIYTTYLNKYVYIKYVCLYILLQMYGRALAAVDRVFAVGVQAAFPVSAELIFRRLRNVSYEDIQRMNSGGSSSSGGGGAISSSNSGGAGEMSRRSSNMMRGSRARALTDSSSSSSINTNSIATTTTPPSPAAALRYPIPEERRAEDRRAQRRLVLLSNSHLMQRAAALNMFDIQLYRYGELACYYEHTCIHPYELKSDASVTSYMYNIYTYILMSLYLQRCLGFAGTCPRTRISWLGCLTCSSGSRPYGGDMF